MIKGAIGVRFRIRSYASTARAREVAIRPGARLPDDGTGGPAQRHARTEHHAAGVQRDRYRDAARRDRPRGTFLAIDRHVEHVVQYHARGVK